MNLSKVYAKAVEPNPSDIPHLEPLTNEQQAQTANIDDFNRESKALQAKEKENFRRLNHVGWLNGSFTQTVLAEILEERNRLNNAAIQQAVLYPNNNINHQQIISNLVRVAQLDIILHTYARVPSDPTDNNTNREVRGSSNQGNS